MIRFECDMCGVKLRVPNEYAGREVACPRCAAVGRVPGTPSLAEVATVPSTAAGALGGAALGAANPSTGIVGDVLPPLDAELDAPLSKPVEEVDPEELIDMTAMVDIVFFLLIFFLVTSMSVLSSSMQMPTPESQASGGASRTLEQFDADGDLVLVRIARDDSLEIEGIPVANLTELQFQLKQLRNSSVGPTSLLVVGHPEATHGAAVAVLDTGYETGFEKVQLSVNDGDAE